MPRYIDADALNAYIESAECNSVGKALQAIDNAPTISPDEVRGVGEWIVEQTAIGKDYTICSACKTDFKFKTDKGTLARLDMRGMPFCPSCGARMKGAEDEQD